MRGTERGAREPPGPIPGLSVITPLEIITAHINMPEQWDGGGYDGDRESCRPRVCCGSHSSCLRNSTYLPRGGSRGGSRANSRVGPEMGPGLHPGVDPARGPRGGPIPRKDIEVDPGFRSLATGAEAPLEGRSEPRIIWPGRPIPLKGTCWVRIPVSYHSDSSM